MHQSKEANTNKKIQRKGAKTLSRKEECVSIRLSMRPVSKIFTTETTEEGRRRGIEEILQLLPSPPLLSSVISVVKILSRICKLSLMLTHSSLRLRASASLR